MQGCITADSRLPDLPQSFDEVVLKQAGPKVREIQAPARALHTQCLM
jgi:hypothetical protein